METNAHITFSIIIPTYNSGKILATALESIANQTYRNLEVRVMDGLSDDNTLAIVTHYQAQIPQLYVHSENDAGIYDAMNKGMDKAEGRWLFFMGSDDAFYNSNVLEQVHNHIVKTKKHVVYGNAKIIGDTGWAADGDVYDGVFDIKKLLKKNICHQALFYRTSFIKKHIGYFNLDYKKSSDWDFNIRCWAKEPFAYIDLIVANFVAGGFSTHSTDTRIAEDFLDNVLKYFHIDPFNPLVNNPNFTYYGKVILKQQKEFPIRYRWNRLLKRIKNKLKA